MKKDIRYVPSPPAIVKAMLSLAEVGPKDVGDDWSADRRITVEDKWLFLWTV